MPNDPTHMHVHRLNAHAAGTSCAVITGILYAVCAIAYALVPDATLSLFNLLFHGIDFRKVAAVMSWGGAISGLMLTVVGAYAVTWAWTALYNRLLGPGSSTTTTGGDDCCK